jgi:hypothetical protein
MSNFVFGIKFLYLFQIYLLKPEWSMGGIHKGGIWELEWDEIVGVMPSQWI